VVWVVQFRVLPTINFCLRGSSLVFFLIAVLLGLPLQRCRDDGSIEPPGETGHQEIRRPTRRFAWIRLPAILTIFLVLLYALALPGR
jgi:hypothetical protein